MLIRTEQIGAFEEGSERIFEDKLCAYVREKMPTVTISLNAEQLRDIVISHLSAARQFGLRSQSSIAQFVCLAFLPGPPFYENKYLNAFLRYAGFDPDAKMQCIVDQIGKELARKMGAAGR